jgi:hypothetical protein
MTSRSAAPNSASRSRYSRPISSEGSPQSGPPVCSPSGHEQFEEIVGEHGLEGPAQFSDVELRSSRPGARERHGVYQRLEMSDVGGGVARRSPLAGQATEHRRQPLSHQLESHELGVVVARRFQRGREQQANVSPSRADRDAGHGPVARAPDGRLENRQWGGLHLRRRERHDQAVLCQRLGAEQRDAPAPRVQPQAQQIVG